MTKSELIPSGKGNLSSIMKAEASIAMPEVVSVFISKYESELYDRKQALQVEIGDAKKDMEILNATALKKADFSAYIGLKIPKLDIISEQSGNTQINWQEGEYSATIILREDIDRGRDLGARKEVMQKIPKSFINQYEKLNDAIDTAASNLQDIIAKISDMSRKERQVKARISELRLQEQGLEGFLGDPEMMKLIKID